MNKEEKKSNKTEAKPTKIDNSHQWDVDYLIEQFAKESDRAAVILVASIIDGNLETLLKSHLVPIPTSKDSLFDSATSPLSNFSSKIDLAYRVGLISSKFCRDLHLLRKIRNSFAHDIYGCAFDSGSVKARVRELENSFSNRVYEEKEAIRKRRNDDLLNGTRGSFLFMTTSMIWEISDLIKESNELSPSENEFFYET
ncbi:MAG: hypothetical protein RIE52_13965 [Balneola sp.]|jgi:hypothetical protein